MNDFVTNLRHELVTFRDQVNLAIQLLDQGNKVDEEISMLTVGADDLHHMIRDHYGQSEDSNPKRWDPAKLNDEELDALLDNMMDSSFGPNKAESSFLDRLFEVENFPRRPFLPSSSCQEEEEEEEGLQ